MMENIHLFKRMVVTGQQSFCCKALLEKNKYLRIISKREIMLCKTNDLTAVKA